MENRWVKATETNKKVHKGTACDFWRMLLLNVEMHRSIDFHFSLRSDLFVLILFW